MHDETGGDGTRRDGTRQDGTGRDGLGRDEAETAGFRPGSALTRRRLLSTGAAVGLAATAGCLDTREGAVPGPVVTDGRIDDGWRLVEESDGVVFEEAFGPVTIRALEHTLLYEYVDLAEALAETFDASGSPVVFFASRIDLRPAIDRLPGGIGRDRLMEEVRPAAEAAFRDQLRESGLEDVDVEETGTETVTGGHTASTARFSARFPVTGETPLPDGSTEGFDDVITVEARLALWHDGMDVLLSGGAYPTEPVSDVISRALPDAVADESLVDDLLGDDAEALSTEPETFAEAVEALLVAVE
ncbi:hypothetical protein [Halorubrum sp. JWXQ-INN 858]|uniref:hypothetical protein n=1 Tax=Halorubrum sp. JWXQ-INN 858 TaxID=2690782 RepID=UPI001F3B0AC3|nr:hypothetical protein [Halorubrum sp. JWXQ-INN 858]